MRAGTPRHAFWKEAMARVTSRRRIAPSGVVQNDDRNDVEHVRHERQRNHSGECSEYGATGSLILDRDVQQSPDVYQKIRHGTVIIACPAGAFNPMFEPGCGRRRLPRQTVCRRARPISCASRTVNASAWGVQPHRLETFKLSTTPAF